MVALPRTSRCHLLVTHVIKKVRGQKMLVRTRFACGCGSVGRQ